MNDHGYSRYIKESIDNYAFNIPIKNISIAKSMAEKYALELQYAQRIVNQNMKRLADQELIVHFTKGVYYKPVDTPFGKSVLDREDYYFKELTVMNGEPIGYETCPSVLNTIGLCTLMTAEKNVVTNLYRKVLPKGIRLKTEKPKAAITKENMRYFQLADILADMKNYMIDADDPKKILNEYISNYKIEPIKLIAYAKKYYTEKEFDTIIDFFTEDLI